MSAEGEVPGQRARQLLSELRGATSLPAYADETVRGVLAECLALDRELVALVAEAAELPADDALRVPAVVYDATVARNARALLAYHSRRCEMLEDLRWAAGPALAALPVELRSKLSAPEADYFRAYSEALAQFAADAGVDATADRQAPKEATVEVVALRDCGELMTTRGRRDVREREVHVMRRADAEPLVRNGWLRHITDRA